MADRTRSRPGLLAAGSLLFAQVAASLIGWALVLFRGMEADGCSDRCDFALIGGAASGFLGASVLLLILASTGVALLWRAGEATWWPPIVAIVLLGVGYVAANALVNGGLSR